MATIADNNNTARSGLKLDLDSGILTGPERHILGAIPTASCSLSVPGWKSDGKHDLVDGMPMMLTDCLTEKIWTFLTTLGVWVWPFTQAGFGLRVRYHYVSE